MGSVAIRVRDVIRQVVIEHELTIISGKVARDHVHVFVGYRPHQDVSTIVQWLKGISSRVLLQEFEHLRKGRGIGEEKTGGNCQKAAKTRCKNS